MPDGNVSGSVIQRTFVGGDLPAALFAASVPLNEVAAESVLQSNSAMKRLIAEVLAVPSNTLLDETEYQDLARRLADSYWPRFWLRFSPEPFWDEWLYAWKPRVSDLFEEVQSSERPLRMFAEHSIALMLAGEGALTPYLFGVPLPPGKLREVFGVETDETAFATGMACLNARLGRSRGTANFTKTVLQYDLPVGSSPRASSDSLLKLLDSGKKMCLAPIAAGGTLGIGQLSQGQYVGAILSVTTGAVMTLILLGSIAVGSLLVARVAQRRDHGSGG